MSRKAIECSSSATSFAGISCRTMRQNRQSSAIGILRWNSERSTNDGERGDSSRLEPQNVRAERHRTEARVAKSAQLFRLEATFRADCDGDRLRNVRVTDPLTAYGEDQARRVRHMVREHAVD